MLHFGIVRPDERGLITNPLGLAAVRLTIEYMGQHSTHTQNEHWRVILPPVQSLVKALPSATSTCYTDRRNSVIAA